MAFRAPKLDVRLSSRARVTLSEIWAWNAKKYDIERADNYIEFLDRKTRELSSSYQVGKPVPTRSRFRYVLMKRRTGGHGHLAVYEITVNGVFVLNYYHTAQDWQSKIEEIAD